jgi:hypothetical protein
VNSGGEVVFQGRLDDNTWGIFLASGGTVETIAHESGPFDHISMSYFGNHPAIDDSGTVAFSGWLDTGERGIYTSSGGAVSTVVDDEGPWTAFSWDPELNEDGSVVFSATPETGPNGIFLQTNSTTIVVAEVNETVLGMETPVVNSSGDVAFSACFLDNDGCAETGILTGDDPVADKVIRQGDLLFGAATTKINFYKGLNDNGQIAFAYELDNGVTGVAIATPVIDGDFNHDGTVDAADYVVWRKNPGGIYTPDDYNTWRTNFGLSFSFGPDPGAAASAASQSSTIPEPATLVILMLAAAGWCLRRGRAD